MKLYAPEFEKALKQGIRHAIHSDAKLQKEYRRAKGRRRPIWAFYMSRLVFSCMLAASVSTVLNLTNHPETALAVVVLWTLAAASFLSALLAPSRLHGSDVRALQLLPVSDFTIYLFRRDKILGFHSMVLLDMLVGLGTLAFLLALPWPSWLGLPVIAGLAWVFNVALAMFVAAKFPRFRTGWLASGVTLLFVAWLIGNRYDGPQMIAALDFAAPTLNLVLPTGWPLDFFHFLAGGSCWPPILGLVPIAYIIWSYQNCERLVSGRFTYQEPSVALESSEQVPEALVQAGAQAGRPVGVTAITEGILSRDCFVLPYWDEDWVQRILWRWLTPREQILANFVFPKPLTMIRPWGRIMRHLLIATVVWQIMRILIPSMENIVLIFAMMVPLLEVLNQSWPAGAAFRTVRTFGIRISLLAPYPVAFQEISNLLLKCTVIQLPAVAAIVTCLSLTYAASHSLPWLNGLLMGLRVTLLLMALRLALLVLNFGSMSNDTSRSWQRTLVALFVCIFEICLFVGLAALALFIPAEPWAWLSGVSLVGTQYGFLCFYGWLWNRGSIDLMSMDAR
ncbi:MAG: hypothetical protein LV481_10585 [Methylacidiphilales bacterium]|nr:hypothetical protein [Candidatus Methylacidiphilales bacterium]